MTREILFRGKVKSTGEWVYGCYVFDEYQDYIIEYGENIKYEVIKETVGQYIGLTDETDKKIFDGDIAKYGISGIDDKIRYFEGEVKWSDRGYWIINGWICEGLKEIEIVRDKFNEVLK